MIKPVFKLRSRRVPAKASATQEHAPVNLPALATAESAQIAVEHERPAGVRSPTVVGLQVAGWLLLACLFLPVCRGCNGVIVRPVDGLALTPPVHASEILGCAALLGVYGNGALVAMLVTISAVLRSRVFWWRTFVWQATFSLCLGLTILTFALVNGSALKEWLERSLAAAPPAVGSVVWIGRALRRGELERAWARLQHVWTIGAWFELNMHCIFSGGVLYGYWLTLSALVAQLSAVELARHRLHHDLWDRSQPIRRAQFSVASLFVWMTLLPLTIAYYQALGPAIDWLLGET